MKHRLFSVFIALILSVSAFAQIPAAEFQKAKVVWYGLDFTKARMIGSEGFTDPQAIQRDYFQKWNGLIVTEADKYDIKGAFKKDNIDINLDPVNALNAKVDASTLVINKSYGITKEDVQNAVSAYKTDQPDGYGICFVVESFDKMQENAFVWVTVFDAKTKKVVVTERLSGKANGFGFRNYWAGAIDELLKSITSKKLKAWFTK